MKYGPIAEHALERRMLEAPNGPRAVLDASVPLLLSKSLMIACRLGLFERLREEPCSAAELASLAGLDPEMLNQSLRLLWGAGYLSYEERRYSLTPLARGNLLAGSRRRCVAHIGLFELLWNALGDMEEVMRSGRGLDVHRSFTDPMSWNTYQAAMLEDARVAAPVLAALLPVPPGARKLLDLGGSHGLYGALICRAHPPLRSIVFDLPDAIEHSRCFAREEGLTDVVTHLAGNVLDDDPGVDYDVVLLSNLLHHLQQDQCVGLISRLRHAVRPDGTVAIWEWSPPDPDAPPDVSHDAITLFFRAISPGRCHSADEYSRWLGEAGFTQIHVRRPAPTLMPQQMLVTARAP